MGDLTYTLNHWDVPWKRTSPPLTRLLMTSKVAGRLFCTCTEMIEPMLAERPAENVAEA
jgi:hypothetical protein